MTYTCFPDQSPFPLPPGVTTPPAAPELIDNGPQVPPNSIDISFFDLAVIGAVGAAGDWLEALISTDSSGTDWTLALLSDDSNPVERDLCELAALLDLLPNDELFVPEVEDPAAPVLPPFKEIFYVAAPIRLTGSWFFIPGPVTLEQGAITAVVKPVAFAGAPVGGAVRSVLNVQSDGLFTRLVGLVTVSNDVETVITGKVRLVASVLSDQAVNAGVAFGLTVTKP